jgi:uncharacterized protein
MEPIKVSYGTMPDAIGLIFGTSLLRRQVLGALFARRGVEVHPRELARQLGRPPQTVNRELDRLEAAGILVSSRIGRARRYQVDEASPIAAEVRALVVKTIGVEARLRSALVDLPGVEEAFIYGSYARGSDRPTSDVDVMIIGTPDRRTLSERLVGLEQDLGRDVNVTAYAHDEFEALRAGGDTFLADVLAGPRIALDGGRRGA